MYDWVSSINDCPHCGEWPDIEPSQPEHNAVDSQECRSCGAEITFMTRVEFSIRSCNPPEEEAPDSEEFLEEVEDD